MEAADEDLTFEAAAFVEGEGRIADGFEGGEGGFLASAGPGGFGVELVEDGGVRDDGFAFTDLHEGLGGDFAGEGEGSFEEVTVDDAVYEAGSEGGFGSDGFAEDTHAGSDGEVGGETGESLGSGGSGDEADFDFRLADLACGGNDPIVAAHGDFEATTERGAVEGHHNRQGRVFDAADDGGKIDWLGGSGDDFTEFPDVGPGDERGTRTDDNNGGCSGVRDRVGDAGGEPLGHSGAQGVNRRVVDGDNCDIGVDRELYEFVHSQLLVCQATRRNDASKLACPADC